MNKEEIIQELRTLDIFQRFPYFIPFIGEKYTNASPKLLLVWESYYDTKGDTLKYNKNNNKDWYYNEKEKPEIEKLFERKDICKGKEEYQNHWNFASKMHPEVRKTVGATFSRVAELIDFDMCAGYNYYLRPATKPPKGEKRGIRDTELDNQIAAETLKEIIKKERLNPQYVIFFSKKSYESFKPFKAEIQDVKFISFVHPSCSWWNTKMKKHENMTGKECFEKFVKEKLKKLPQ
jgi:hypothetical protein